jgi:V/A-type H+-transporting ATPase subunit E
MSLQNLKSSIEEIADQKKKALIEEAQKEAKRIIEEANLKAEHIKNETLKTKKQELLSEERSELAIEEVKWKRKILETKARTIEKIFMESENRFSQVVKGPKYRRFLEDAIVEAAKNIQGIEFIIRINKRDRKIIQSNISNIDTKIRKIKRSKINIEISKDNLDSLGGVLLSNKSLTEYFNNTLEARLLKAKDRLRGKFYKEFYGV